MGARKLNQNWRLRVIHGKPKRLTPEQLWSFACDYFQYCDDNPLFKEEIVCSGGKITSVKISKYRVYTWVGFSLYLREHHNIKALNHYRYNTKGRYSEFVDIVQRIGNVIYVNKFELAAAGLINSRFIARELFSKKRE